MTSINKTGIVYKINQLKGSRASNYLETKERLFLQSLLSKLQNNDEKSNLTVKEVLILNEMYKKYKKYF